jgi:hypothetical protein
MTGTTYDRKAASSKEESSESSQSKPIPEAPPLGSMTIVTYVKYTYGSVHGTSAPPRNDPVAPQTCRFRLVHGLMSGHPETSDQR